MMGDGIAIQPNEGIIVSPVDGKIESVYEKSEHAIGIVCENGLEVIIHIGLDTVNLSEKVFHSLVKVGNQVKAGDTLVEYNQDTLKKLNVDDITMCVFPNVGKAKNLVFEQEGIEVKAKESAIGYYK